MEVYAVAGRAPRASGLVPARVYIHRFTVCVSPLYFRWHRSRYLKIFYIFTFYLAEFYYNILSTSGSYYNIEFVFW